MASPDGTASKLTPVQSNSEENDTMYVQKIPSLDTDADQMLIVNEANSLRRARRSTTAAATVHGSGPLTRQGTITTRMTWTIT